MLNDRLKSRLDKDRPMTSITLRIPVDVVATMKTIAPQRGFSGYQTLLKSYVSEGLRRDEKALAASAMTRLVDSLRRQGVSDEILERAEREALMQS